MKKIQSALSLCLAFALLCCSLSGCGAAQMEAEDSSAPLSTVEETTDEAGTSEVIEDTADATEAEESTTEVEQTLPITEAEPVEAEEAEAITEGTKQTISYPLTNDTITLTIMSNCFPDVSSMLDGQLSNTYACQLAEEVTGVALDSILFLDTTQFTMAITSGEYPDLFANNLVDSYPGGRTAMYEDGIIIDFANMLETYAPDYYTYFSQDSNFAEQLTLDSGEVVSMSVYGKPINQGAIIRQDLLDKLGLEVPETYDELETVLKEFVNSGEVQTGLYLYGMLYTDNYSGFYNGFDLSMTGASLEFQVEDGVVAMSIMTPQYETFINKMHQWYEDGLIPQDFYTLSYDGANGVLLNGTVGFSYSGTDYMDPAFFEGSNAEGAQWVPIADIRQNTEQVLKYGPTMQNVTSMCQLMISTTCEYPEEALSYFNWFFTEEGAIAFNLGEEGVSYTVNGDGSYTYTDLILHNVDGLSVRQARWLYAGIDVIPYLYVTEWQDAPAATNDYQKTAVEIWNQNKTTEGIYYGDMTTEETEQYTAISSDVVTYIESMIPAFVTGAADLSQWGEFISTVEEMGGLDLVALKQAAYDRYVQR